MTTVLGVSSLACSAQLGTGLNRQDMDLSQKPGTDFFEYAAGGWMKAHPLTPEFSRYSQFDALQEQNEKQMRQLITELAEKQQPAGSVAQKIGSLYRLSMDSLRRNAQGAEPVKPLLQQVWATDSKPALFRLIARLSRMGVPSMFAVGCDADLRDSKNNLVQIAQGGLSMGERDYYLRDDEAMKKVREAYRSYIQKLFTLSGETREQAENHQKAVLSIETAIAEQNYDAVRQRDVEGNYHKMSLQDLLRDYPGIDWTTLFWVAGYPSFEQVSVNQPEPIHNVEKLWAESSLDDLKAYTAFKLINDAANALDDNFRQASFDFYSRTMRGAQQDRPRWKRAVAVVNGVLGEAVGQMYVQRYFPESSKQRMQQLVANLQTALAERIRQQSWMSTETKARAIEKLEAFYVKIGYPDKWKDYTALTIDESKSFYENLCAASEFENEYEIRQTVGHPVDKDKWYMTPQTINAYYNPTTNEICFPAGILQPPFFNPQADDACNYGAIGVVIGHEMTHGFDDQGSQFDKDGNLRNWWTEEDAKNFAQRTKVMADFFDKIEVLPGMRANGKLTLGENIADHGGLNIAFLALQQALKQHPLATVDGFTPEQRFFLSYGLIWGCNTREEMLRQLNVTDPHSPGRWRVNGALPHIDEWYKAFGITKSSPLFVAKKDRVNVW